MVFFGRGIRWLTPCVCEHLFLVDVFNNGALTTRQPLIEAAQRREWFWSRLSLANASLCTCSLRHDRHCDTYKSQRMGAQTSTRIANSGSSEPFMSVRLSWPAL